MSINMEYDIFQPFGKTRGLGWMGQDTEQVKITLYYKLFGQNCV